MITRVLSVILASVCLLSSVAFAEGKVVCSLVLEGYAVRGLFGSVVFDNKESTVVTAFGDDVEEAYERMIDKANQWCTRFYRANGGPSGVLLIPDPSCNGYALKQVEIKTLLPDGSVRVEIKEEHVQGRPENACKSI